MDPLITASLISGAGGALTSYMGAKSSATSAKKQMAFQMMQQMMQQSWEKQKMQHAHQWEMQDLKNAGLNPALTAMGGSGASGGSIGMGSGAMADTSGYTASANAILESVKNSINSAQTEKRIENENAMTEAEVANKNADTLNKMEEYPWISKKNTKAIEEAESRIINNQINSAKQTAETHKIQEEINETKGGLITKVFGTDPTKVQGAVNALGLIGGGGVLGGALKGYKAFKAIRSAKNFGKFVNSIGK